MTKVLRIRMNTQVVDHNGQKSVRISCDSDSVPHWSLALCLLDRALVDSVTIIGEPHTAKLQLRTLTHQSERTKVALNSTNEAQTVAVALVPTDLAYLLAFFLKYYRDGVAEVDHIDLQCLFDGANSEENYVTFVARDHAAPLSPAEARKRLGLE